MKTAPEQEYIVIRQADLADWQARLIWNMMMGKGIKPLLYKSVELKDHPSNKSLVDYLKENG